MEICEERMLKEQGREDSRCRMLDLMITMTQCGEIERKSATDYIVTELGQVKEGVYIEKILENYTTYRKKGVTTRLIEKIIKTNTNITN